MLWKVFGTEVNAPMVALVLNTCTPTKETPSVVPFKGAFHWKVLLENWVNIGKEGQGSQGNGPSFPNRIPTVFRLKMVFRMDMVAVQGDSIATIASSISVMWRETTVER